MDKDNLKYINGVYVSPAAGKKFAAFEAEYLKIREKENRILSLEEIKHLPQVAKTNKDFDLWRIREKSIRRFIDYISTKKKTLRVLDIGCGNGFFTNLLSLSGCEVVGLDVNLTELKQAAIAFPNEKITWYYLDILEEKLPEKPFDLVTFCGSFHYFPDPAAILKRCKTLLNASGEIHIIDSPFYSEADQENAKQRSSDYFKALGVEMMSKYYHHNSYESIGSYAYSFKYKPGNFLNKLLRMKDSPFPWLIIR